MSKPVDTSKKSNIKCEHCKHWGRVAAYCLLKRERKNYWNRCKQFEWATWFKYKGNDNGTNN